MGFNLDTAQRSQVQTPVHNRSIYDASTGEVFGKSLIAGFALGLGNAIATALFFGVIAGLLITAVTPIFEQLHIPWSDLQLVLPQPVSQPTLTPSILPSSVPSSAPATVPTTTFSATPVGE
jgi:hypothetical protein